MQKRYNSSYWQIGIFMCIFLLFITLKSCMCTIEKWILNTKYTLKRMKYYWKVFSISTPIYRTMLKLSRAYRSQRVRWSCSSSVSLIWRLTLPVAMTTWMCTTVTRTQCRSWAASVEHSGLGLLSPPPTWWCLRWCLTQAGEGVASWLSSAVESHMSRVGSFCFCITMSTTKTSGL